MLDWYFGLKYGVYISYGLLLLLPLGYIYLKHLEGFKQYYRKSVTIGMFIVLGLNVAFVSFINPKFLGLGTPQEFVFVQVRKDHIVLFDNLYTFYLQDPDMPGDSRSRVPQLRVHVLDKATGKRKYRKLIGTDYYPMQYGSHVLLVKQNVNQISDDFYLKAVYYFDVESQTAVKLAKLNDKLQTDSTEIKVYSISASSTEVIVRSNDGFKYLLDKSELRFKTVHETDYKHHNNKFSLQLEDAGSHRYRLYSEGRYFDQYFIKGKIQNEILIDTTDYVLIMAYKSLPKNDPYIAMHDENGELVWTKTLKELKKEVRLHSVHKFHRIILTKKSCFVTLKNAVINLDILSGNIIWKKKL